MFLSLHQAGKMMDLSWPSFPQLSPIGEKQEEEVVEEEGEEEELLLKQVMLAVPGLPGAFLALLRR